MCVAVCGAFGASICVCASFFINSQVQISTFDSKSCLDNLLTTSNCRSSGHLNPELNNAICEVSLPPQQSGSAPSFEWKGCFLSELQEFNVYFTDTEVILLHLFTLNCCKSVPWFQLLRAAQGVPQSFKIKFFFFFSSNKNITMCFDTLSDELNMQTSRLPRTSMDYITYGFFESNKNRANLKVHPTQNNSSL